MIRTIIIEDEENVKISTEAKLNKYCPNVSLIGWADTKEKAIALIRETQPDLVLLDIKLPDGTGFEVLKAFHTINFSVIFLTAYNEFAVEAFHFSAIDYLMKPVRPEELQKAIAKSTQSINLQSIESRLDSLYNNLEQINRKEKRLVLSSMENIRIVDLDEIIRCEADVNYTIFWLNDGKKIVVSKTLKDYDDILTSYGFFRPHKSHLINITYLKSYERCDGGYLVMKDGSQVPLAIRKKEELMKIFEKL